MDDNKKRIKSAWANARTNPIERSYHDATPELKQAQDAKIKEVVEMLQAQFRRADPIWRVKLAEALSASWNGEAQSYAHRLLKHGGE